MSSLRSILRSGLRLLWFAAAFAVIAAAVLFGVVRWALPLADNYQAEIVRRVGAVLGHSVNIASLDAGWHGRGPSLELEGLTILGDDEKRVLLKCDSARVDFDLFASLRHLQIELDQLTVRGASVSVLRREDGSLTVMGLSALEQQPDQAAPDAFKRWLARQPRLNFEASAIEWRDLMPEGRHIKVKAERVQIRNLAERHRLDAQLVLPAQLGKTLTLTAEVSGDLFSPAAWTGHAYLRGGGLALDAWPMPAASRMEVRSGRADVELWSEWRNGAQRVAGRVAAADAQLASRAAGEQAASPPSVPLATLRGQFEWRRHADGWELDIDQMSLHRAESTPWPLSQWRLVYRDAPDGSHQLEAGFGYLNVADAFAIAYAAGLLPESQHALLMALAPRGDLHDAYLRHRWGGTSIPSTLLRTAFRQVAVSKAEKVPGIEGVSGTLVSDGNRGVVELRAGAGMVDATPLFRRPLPLESAGARVAWRRFGSSWQIGSDDLNLRNEDLRARAAFRLVRLDGMASSHLELHAEFGDGNGAHAARYLPAGHMHEQAVSWLDKAILNGRVTQGEARLSGWLNEFPFDRRQGVFTVGFNVHQGILDYSPGWPRLRDIKTSVLFHGRSLDIDASAARAFDSNVLAAKVSVADLTGDPAVVKVSGTARGPTADAVRFVTESPLHDKFGEYLAGVAASGTSRLNLDLFLPLAHQPARVQGALFFGDSALKLSDVDLDITGIEGRLDFNEEGMRGRGLRARLLDQPAVVDLRGEGEGAAYATVFEAQGTADLSVVAKRFFPPLASRVQGEVPWRGSLKVRSSQKGGTLLQIRSPLAGAAVDLPEPLGKTVEQDRAFSLELPLPLDGRRAARVRYGDALDARMMLASEPGGVTVRRGELRLGGGRAVLPDENVLQVRGDVRRLDVAEWLGVRVAGAAPGAAAGEIDVDVQLKSNALLLMGQAFNATALHARRGPDAWVVDLSGPAMAGALRVPDMQGAPLTAEFTRLYLANSVSDGDSEPAGPSSTKPDPRDLPPLQVHVNDFRYGKLELGSLNVSTARTARGLELKSLQTRSPLHTLEAQGRWEMTVNGRPQSAFSIAFDSADVGETLRRLGYADVVKDGKMRTDMNVKWEGGPADFALARAAGAIAFKISDGRLLDVNPGAGRVLGLLSLQALPRRLSLDFSDFFQKGLAFDRIEGDFKVENGIAETDNLTMDGPAARIIARGRVGLVTEDYEQRVTVIPNVSAGLPWAGALAGGVATGAAMLLLQRLLKERIDEMGRIEYQVSGPWASPVVERVTGSGNEATKK